MPRARRAQHARARRSNDGLRDNPEAFSACLTRRTSGLRDLHAPRGRLTLYTVPELATLIGMHPRTLRRWLAKKPVALLHVGGAVAVPLIAFRNAFPELWASLKTMHELKQSPCPVCGETVKA